jgi:hypothetical protein
VHSSDRCGPPDPRSAATIADLLGALRRLRAWAGMPAYREIADRVARQNPASRGIAGRPAISTIADHFTKTDRCRLDCDLFFALVRALDPSAEGAAWWHEAWEAVFAPVDGRSGHTGRAGQAGQAGHVVAARGSLPERAVGFTGRAAELSLVLDSLDAARIVVISGMAGVGKTALAVYAGWELHRRMMVDVGVRAELRQHGCGLTLYVDLAGFHPHRPPADPAAALTAMLRHLTTPGARIPNDGNARALMYRNRLEHASGVIILDNAADLSQITPLLPESRTIQVIITSRVRLPVPGAQHIRLGGLAIDDSVLLLARLTDPTRVAAEPQAAHRIAERCGRLPLALSLIARHVNTKPHWTLADHATRLGELGLDDGVRAALALSYRSLPTTQATLLRLLAIHPGSDFDGFAASALLGVDAATGSSALADLDRASLIQSVGHDKRYRMHDLVRAFARERAFDDDAASERRAAIRRLGNYRLAGR